MNWRRSRLKFHPLLFLLWAHFASATPKKLISWQPAQLAPGSPVLFQFLGVKDARSITGYFLEHKVEFFRVSGNVWEGLGGVPLETKPGVYEFRVEAGTYDKKMAALIVGKQRIRVFPAHYPKISVKVEKKYTEPSPQQLAEISADKEVKQKTFGESAPNKLWQGNFAPPVNLPISDVFGTARVFNGEVQSRHQGLDFAAPAGTPVFAINSGTVILAHPLYFEGGCVVIDHGQGLMSLYLHLSDFKVKEGVKVQKGQEIALSGGSGRASGPHLHLAVRWQGVYLNPAILLKMEIH